MSYRYVQEPDSFYNSTWYLKIYLYIRKKLGIPLRQYSPRFKRKRDLEKWFSDIGFKQPIENKQVLSAYLWIEKIK